MSPPVCATLVYSLTGQVAGPGAAVVWLPGPQGKPTTRLLHRSPTGVMGGNLSAKTPPFEMSVTWIAPRLAAEIVSTTVSESVPAPGPAPVSVTRTTSLGQL